MRAHEVQSVAFNDQDEQMVLAIDRILELWQLPTHLDAAHRRTTGKPVLSTAQKIRTVQLPPNSAPAELDRAAVLQILWAPMLPVLMFARCVCALRARACTCVCMSVHVVASVCVCVCLFVRCVRLTVAHVPPP